MAVWCSPGHTSTTYQAKGAEYLFRTHPRSLLLLPDGATLSDRAVAKVRADDRGHDYVERRLQQSGAPRRLPAAGVRHLRHGGMHRYAFRLGRTRTERGAVRIVVPGPVPAGSTLAYPKLPDAVQGVLW